MITSVAALGLIGYGGWILFKREDEDAAMPVSYVPPSPATFHSITGRIVTPRNFETVEETGVFSETYPVIFTLNNPSDQSATVTAEFIADEDPNIGDGQVTRQYKTVTLGPGQFHQDTMNMPMSTNYPYVDYIDINLTLRIMGSQGRSQLIDTITFVVD